MKLVPLKWAVPIILLAACVSGLTASLLLTKKPGPYTGVEPRRDLARLEKRLREAVDQSPDLTLHVLGQVNYGGFSAPLWAVSYTPPAEVRGRVFLAGGVHGNEPAGTESVLRFVEKLAGDPTDFKGIAFDMVPLVNPWGWVHKYRRNQQALDINRDFNSFQSQEAKLLRTFLEGKKYDLAIDEHEDSDAAGFYLYELATGRSKLCRNIIERQRAKGYPIEQDEWMVIFKTRDGLISAPLWSLYAALPVQMTSLSIYCRLNNSSQVYLIETPGRLPMEDRLDMHQSAREMIITGIFSATGKEDAE